MEAFRDSEEQQAATVGQLHNKMNASLLDMASLSSNDTDKKQDKTMGRATVRKAVDWIDDLLRLVSQWRKPYTKKPMFETGALCFYFIAGAIADLFQYAN